MSEKTAVRTGAPGGQVPLTNEIYRLNVEEHKNERRRLA